MNKIDDCFNSHHNNWCKIYHFKCESQIESPFQSDYSAKSNQDVSAKYEYLKKEMIFIFDKHIR